MTPVVRMDWEVYVKGKLYSTEIFNSDSKKYWGTGKIFNPDIRSELINEDEELYKVTINLPALSGLILK